MNKSIVYISLFIFIIALHLSCQIQGDAKQSTAQQATTPEKSKSTVYKRSELALLMRQMFDELNTTKEYIVTGKGDSIHLSDFFNIHSAKATDPTVRDQQFKGMSDALLQHVKKLEQQPGIETFNATIDVCLTCHQSYCPGPMRKIKKLTI